MWVRVRAHVTCRLTPVNTVTVSSERTRRPREPTVGSAVGAKALAAAAGVRVAREARCSMSLRTVAASCRAMVSRMRRSRSLSDLAKVACMVRVRV